MKFLNNRDLVHFIDKIDDNSKKYIIMENYQGNSLRNYINDIYIDERAFDELVFFIFIIRQLKEQFWI